MIAIRGAITVEENTVEAMNEATKVLLNQVFEKNNLVEDDLISILFSATIDLDAQYPAVAAREIGLTETPLFCVQELNIKGSLNKCIRVLVHCQKEMVKNEVQHIYLRGAKVLRPDIVGEE
jgi:chorismate mutase